MADTSGMARPSACGQVMIITVTMRSSENRKVWPTDSQTASVTKPTDRAVMVSQRAALSARRWVWDFPSCAC